MAVEIHEDQPYVEPSAAWLRRVWLPAIDQNYYAGRYIHPAEIAFGQRCHMTWRVLPDFTSMTTLIAAMYSTVGHVPTLSTTIYFGSVGENPAVHTQTIALAPVLVANTMYELDLAASFAALLANLVPGDYLVIRFNNQTAANSIYIYGAEAVYA